MNNLVGQGRSKRLGAFLLVFFFSFVVAVSVSILAASRFLAENEMPVATRRAFKYLLAEVVFMFVPPFAMGVVLLAFALAPAKPSDDNVDAMRDSDNGNSLAPTGRKLP
jgi:hypothetical protein